MSKKYRKKSPPRSYQANSSSKVGLIVFGILIGLFFAIMLYWQQNEKTKPHEESAAKESAISVNTDVKTQKTSAPSKPAISKPTVPIKPANTTAPEFDFYTVLPKMQVNPAHPAVSVKAPVVVSTPPVSAQPPTIVAQTTNPVSTEASPTNLTTQIAATTKPETATNKNVMTAPLVKSPVASVLQTPAASLETTPATSQKSVSESAPASQIKKAPQKSPDNKTSVATKEIAKEKTIKSAPISLSETTKPEASLSASSAYLLQMASFKSYADADRLKAQLTMLGLDVYIQSYTSNNQVHNRVVMGPYPLKSAAIQAQTRLQKSHISSTLIKAP